MSRRVHTSWRRRLRIVAAALSLLGTLLVASTAALSAHAVVFPGEAPTGSYQKYVLRVPNERDVTTVRVMITFPAGVRVISFDEVPGWTLEAIGADEDAYAAATWTGTLPVARFAEFSFIGVNPAEPATLKWDVIQTYADGTEVAWTGPVESSTPASVTRVLAAADGDEEPASGGGLGTVLGGAARLVALLSLGLSLRAPKGD